jgi:drug/metabolite transporter (DMT)-like permease
VEPDEVKSDSQKWFAFLSLLCAGALWGYAFVAQKQALAVLGPASITAVRFAIAFLCLLPFCRFKNWSIGFWPGLFIFLVLYLQTWGLETTTAAKSGFITTFYVVLTPFAERLVQKVKLRFSILLWAGVALVGMALISDPWGSQGNGWVVGDTLTLLCAVASAAHLIATSQAMKKLNEPLQLHFLQCGWVMLFASVTALAQEPLPQHFSELSQVATPLIYLGVGPTAIALYFLVRAQKTLSPSTVGLLALMEAPFAAVFSVIILHEQTTWVQICGATLVLGAAVLETISSRVQSA